MRAKLLIAVILAVLVAVPASIILGNLNSASTTQKAAQNIAQESIPPGPPKIEPVPEQVQAPQQPPINKDMSQGLTYVGGFVSVRRAIFPAEGCRTDRPMRCIEMPEQVLFSNLKLKDALEKSDQGYRYYQNICNINEISKRRCAEGREFPPEPIQIPLTLDELNALKAFFNSGPPLEFREGGTVRLDYGHAVTSNEKVYLISFFTTWKSP